MELAVADERGHAHQLVAPCVVTEIDDPVADLVVHLGVGVRIRNEDRERYAPVLIVEVAVAIA